MRRDFAYLLLSKHNAHSKNASTNYFTLHEAAKRGFYELLKTLLTHPKHPADPKVVQFTSSGHTVIYSAVMATANNTDQEDKALECVQLLTNKGCDIFARATDGAKFTAVHLAAHHQLWKLVEHFLKNNANINLEINKTTARELIKNSKNSGWVENYKGSDNNGDDPRENLFETLNSLEKLVCNEEDFFITFLDKNPKFDLKRVNEICKGKGTLLQCAVKNGLSRAAKILIEKCNADPNNALFDAIEQGEEFISILIESNLIDLNKVTNNYSEQMVLHKAVLSKKPSVNVVRKLLEIGKEKYSNTYYNVWVNSQDYRGFTALHYAVKYRLKDIEQLLMQSSANIFLPDRLGVPAFFDMRPEVVEAYFDMQLELHDDNDASDSHIIFYYTFLDISKCVQTKQAKERGEKNESSNHSPADNGEDGEASDKLISNSENRCMGEIAPLKMLAESPRHKHLVLHPIVTSFLHLKWRRLSYLYWVNLIFYSLFMFFLTGFLFFLDFANSSDNDEHKRNCTNVSKVESPVINKKQTLQNILNTSTLFAWWVGTIILTALLIFREASQVCCMHTQYFKRLENYLEIFIIGATLWLIFFPNQVILPAFLYLSASFEFILLIGKHPRMATNIEMFTTVLTSFIHFLIWYVFLIFAFAVSFA